MADTHALQNPVSGKALMNSARLAGLHPGDNRRPVSGARSCAIVSDAFTRLLPRVKSCSDCDAPRHARL